MKEACLVCLILLVLAQCCLGAKVSSRPMHSGHINPMLFGGFMELLDDLIPGMWAEMLNDRSFEGVTPRANWCYYDGAPNICDREWDKNGSWSYDAKAPFNGARSVRLTNGSLAQSGLAVKRGMTYLFSGWLQADSDVEAEIVLKTLLPDGKWSVLASSKLPKLSGEWSRYAAKLVSTGTTDKAVFELQTTGSVRADKLSLVPTDNLHGWRRDVVQAIKDAHCSIIRWGGSVCDPGGYKWKDGIGDRDRRVPFPNKVWGRIDSNDVGIDEFCRFCELVGVQPLICISFGDGPQSAVDLVQYCNGDASTEWGAKRAANGHPKPYNVKYWQLGNELGNADYVNALPEFCKAMKQADPGIVLMASFPSQEMLDKVGRDIGYIGPHHYTPDFPACDADFNKLAEMIRKTPGCEKVRIAVTEWNTTAGSFGLGRANLMTLHGALQNAQYLNLLMRRSDIVDIACRSNMTNSIGSGMIATNPSGLLKRPSYYIMKLYADHAKPIPVAVQDAPEGVDVSACTSENGKSLCIFAVNMKTEPVELPLDLDASFRPTGGEVICDTQDARQPDIMNHWDSPDRVRAVKFPVSGSTVTLPALSASAIECAGR